MYFLSLLYECVVLRYTLQRQLVHQVYLIRTVQMLSLHTTQPDISAYTKRDKQKMTQQCYKDQNNLAKSRSAFVCNC